MSHDVDQLLRDTLHGRAATVTDALPVPDTVSAGAATGGHRSRWLLVAATITLILVLGAGAAVLGLGHHRSDQKSGGGYARSCRTTLPAAWTKALVARPAAYDGHPTTLVALTSYGDVLSWTDGTGREQLGLQKAAGRIRAFDDVLDGRQVTGTSVDGRTLLVSAASDEGNDPPRTAVTDLVAVDLRTYAVRPVLSAAHMPAGYVVDDKAAAVLDGTVYWTAVPRADFRATRESTRGVVLAFDLAHNRTRTIGHSAPLLSGPDNTRGVFWSGGLVRRAGVPASVPPLRANGYDPVVSDGQNFAWLRADGNVKLIGWADKAGAERRWMVDTVRGPGVIRSDPIAVSGPFVFLEPQGVGDAHVYILDTRRGAVADSGIQSIGGMSGGTRVAITTRANGQAAFRSAIVDTAHLPALHC